MISVYKNIIDKFKIPAYIFVGTDPHQLEYPANKFKLRHVLSGFYGSAGTFLLYSDLHTRTNTSLRTALWTDGRYEEAAKELIANSENSKSNNMELYVSKEQDWNAQIDWVVAQHTTSQAQYKNSNPPHAENEITLKIGVLALQISARNFELIEEITNTYSPHIKIELVELDYREMVDCINASLDNTHILNYILNKDDISIFEEGAEYCKEIFPYDPKLFLWNLQNVQNREILPTQHLVPSYLSRLNKLKDWMRTHNFKIYLSANIHEISWLTGLRSMSMDCLMLFPCCFAFCIDEHKSTTLFIWIYPNYYNHYTKKEFENLEPLLNTKIKILDYNLLLNNPSAIIQILKETATSNNTNPTPNNAHIVCDTNNIPQTLYEKNFKTIVSPLLLWKSISSEEEISLFKYTNILDCAALLEASAEIYALVKSNDKKSNKEKSKSIKSHTPANALPLTEKDASNLIYNKRKQNKYFLQHSFPTISASGANAALPHYGGSARSPNLVLDNVHLIDTGAHYVFGSTDITRVFFWGSFAGLAPPTLLKQDFTAVLKAHITLCRHKISLTSSPTTTSTSAGSSSTGSTSTTDENPPPNQYPTGKELDAIVRDVLASLDRNMIHGTGHGLGFCSDVHEGVQRISPLSNQIIFPNMIFSNEPGVYRNSQWGIRIENIMCSRLSSPKEMQLELMSFFPIQTDLIDFDMLTEDEKSWLEEYHRKCYDTLKPYMSELAEEFFHLLISKK